MELFIRFSAVQVRKKKKIDDFYGIYLGIFVKSCQQAIDAVQEFMANL
jgi:hypothetical protein